MVDSSITTVLLVEFDPDESERLGSWLNEEGYEVISCRGPTEPEYRCIGVRTGSCPLAHGADAVVIDLRLASDIMMRGSPGWEVWSLYHNLGLPMVVLAGSEDPLVPVGDPATAVLRRFPRRDELVACIRSLLIGRPSHGHDLAG